MDTQTLEILRDMEEFRKKHENQPTPPDWAIRVCQAIVAKSAGVPDCATWEAMLDASRLSN
ncbi:MAG: hypothetical protein LBU72_02155 [Burkholderiaceae bacterium]|jgi:hypothetical protein|nr:hypothetical protein [Burkholderiaceae bacterium]